MSKIDKDLKKIVRVFLHFFKRLAQEITHKILPAIFGFLLAILILESFLRISERKTLGLYPCTSLDKNFHHVMIPDKTCRFKTDEWDVIYKINSLGLKDEEIPQTKDADEFRILVLGDSFIQGHGVAGSGHELAADIIYIRLQEYRGLLVRR